MTGEISYDVCVTGEELWRGVSEYLLVERTRRGWNPIDVERHGGPNYATVQAIERGDIKTTDALNRHVAALGYDMSDVIRAVIDRAEGKLPMAPEVAKIARKFTKTTVEGRLALVSLAQALPDAPEQEEPSGSPTPPAAQTEVAPDTVPLIGARGQKQRTKKRGRR